MYCGRAGFCACFVPVPLPARGLIHRCPHATTTKKPALRRVFAAPPSRLVRSVVVDRPAIRGIGLARICDSCGVWHQMVGHWGHPAPEICTGFARQLLGGLIYINEVLGRLKKRSEKMSEICCTQRNPPIDWASCRSHCCTLSYRGSSTPAAKAPARCQGAPASRQTRFAISRARSAMFGSAMRLQSLRRWASSCASSRRGEGVANESRRRLGR